MNKYLILSFTIASDLHIDVVTLMLQFSTQLCRYTMALVTYATVWYNFALNSYTAVALNSCFSYIHSCVIKNCFNYLYSCGVNQLLQLYTQLYRYTVASVIYTPVLLHHCFSCLPSGHVKMFQLSMQLCGRRLLQLSTQL